MKQVIVLSILCFLYTVNAHAVYGTIYNYTPFNLTLVTNIADNGDLNLAPAAFLPNNTKTWFQLDANLINNRIEYLWEYIPEDFCDATTGTVVGGYYKYFYGGNYCSSKAGICSTTQDIIPVSYTDCPDIVVGDSSPNYYITYNDDSNSIQVQ